MERESTLFPVTPRRLVRTVFWAFLGCELTLFLLDYLLNVAGVASPSLVRKIFDTSREDGLANWFGTAQTLLIAITLWIIVAVACKLRRSLPRVGWILLAIFFTYMSVDDGAKIHERVGDEMKRVYKRDDPQTIQGRVLKWFPSNAWQVVYMPIFIPIGVFMVFFLYRELDTWRPRVIVCVAVGTLGFAVGLDFVEGLDSDHPLNVYTRIGDRYGITRITIIHMSQSIEETLEMLSNTILWTVFLGHLARSSRAVGLEFVSADDPQQVAGR